MYKTCKGCKALNFDGSCSLGFENKVIYSDGIKGGFNVGSIPLKPCPKPRTINAYFLEKKLIKNR